MIQQSLLSWSPPRPSPLASEQSRELARVEGRQAEFILAWLALRGEGAEFRLCELEADIAANVGATPGSAGRILRLLRQRGQVGYRVVSRAGSRYAIGWVKA